MICIPKKQIHPIVTLLIYWLVFILWEYVVSLCGLHKGQFKGQYKRQFKGPQNFGRNSSKIFWRPNSSLFGH